MMSSIEERAHLAGFSANGYPRRTRYLSARPNTISTWPFGSRSIAHGSSPPTVSAPSRNASSSSSTRPGRTSMPLCGNATRSISTMSASASRVAITPSMPATPHSVSTSMWLRMKVLPCDTERRARSSDCRRGSIGSVLAGLALVLDLVDQPRPHLVAGTTAGQAAICRDGCGPLPDPAALCARHLPRQARRPGPGRVQFCPARDQNIRGSTPKRADVVDKRSAAIVYPQSTRISQCAPRSRPAMVRAPIRPCCLHRRPIMQSMSNTLSLAIFINLLRLELTTIGPFYRDRRTHCPVLAGSEMASLKRRV